MLLFDNIAKAAKDFFIEETSPEGPSVAAPRPLPGQTAPVFSGNNATVGTQATPLLTQPEQRHLDHIRQLLSGDGKDFMAFTKMVTSLQASGLSGPILYQTAFDAFAAVTSLDLPALLKSAEQFELKLASDRNSILERHREKVGEIRIPNVPASPLVQLQLQEQQLQTGLADLARQLEEAQQRLLAVRQQLQEQQQKATSALASYELAHATASAELKAHQQGVQAYLLPVRQLKAIEPVAARTTTPERRHQHHAATTPAPNNWPTGWPSPDRGAAVHSRFSRLTTHYQLLLP